MEQAKARNPAIKLYGLAWGAPGWIGSGNFWSTDMISYLVSWLGCAKSHGLTINYLGGWNERGYNIGWYEQLRSTLNADGYSAVQVVGADTDWTVANDLVSNSAFSQAVQIVGAHYPCGWMSSQTSCPSSSNAVATGKQLWASENGSQDYNNGAAAMARADNRDYIGGKMTATINWPIVAALYPGFPYDTDGLILANQPWSGWYSVGKQAWVTAQTTQFTAPGWTYIDSAGGYLGGSGSGGNGSYVTLKSPSGSDWSSIIETTQASAAQTVIYTITGGLSTGTVHVWSTDVNSSDPSTWFVHATDITPSNGSFSLTLQPGYVYSLTTSTGQGKGTAASPAQGSLALPYSDNFDSDTAGQQPPYLSQVQGAFEVEPCAGGRTGQCLQQQAPVTPIEWDNNARPLHPRRLVELDQLHRLGRHADRASRRGPADRPGRLPNRLHPARGQRVLPAAIQHRSLVDCAQQQRRPDGHTGQRRGGRAGHRQLAAPGADLQRQLDLGRDQRHHRRHRHRLHLLRRHGRPWHQRLPDRPVRQPVRHPGQWRDGGSTGPITAGDDSAKCADDNGQSSADGTKVQLWDCNGGTNQQWSIP